MEILTVIFGRTYRPWGGVLGTLPAFIILSIGFAQAPSTAPAAARNDPASSLLAVPGVQAGMSTDALLDVAAKAIQAAQFAEAQTILDAVIAQERENLRALSLLAGSYERQAQLKKNSGDPGGVEQSEALLQKAIDVYVVLAPLKVAAGEKREAEQLFTRILLHRPNHAPSQLELARLLAAKEEFRLAIDRYTEYIKNPAATPDLLTKAHIELGRLYRKSKWNAQAVASLNASLKLNAENPEAYIELARTFQAVSSWAQAHKAAESALMKSPDNPEYWDVMASILLAQKKWDEAGGHARRAVDLTRAGLSRQPDQQELWQSLAGFYKTYEQVLREMMNNGKDTAAVRVDLVRVVHEKYGVFDVLNSYQALELLQNTPAAEKNNTRLLETMADLQASLFKLSDAAATCRRLLEIEPQNAVAARILQNLSSQPAPTTQSVVNREPNVKP